MLSFLHKSSYVLSLTVEFYIKTSKKALKKVCCIFIDTVHINALVLCKRNCKNHGIKFRSIILNGYFF